MTTVFITKYALTDGIQERELLQVSDGEKFAIVKAEQMGWNNGKETFYMNDWHRTRGEAVDRAEVMRTNRIASLEKSIKKVKALTFT